MKSLRVKGLIGRSPTLSLEVTQFAADKLVHCHENYLFKHIVTRKQFYEKFGIIDLEITTVNLLQGVNCVLLIFYLGRRKVRLV